MTNFELEQKFGSLEQYIRNTYTPSGSNDYRRVIETRYDVDEDRWINNFTLGAMIIFALVGVLIFIL